MPLVTIKLARRDEPLAADTKLALITGVTQLLVDTLAKRPGDVVVLIEELDPDNWGQGGQSATRLRQARKAAAAGALSARGTPARASPGSP